MQHQPYITPLLSLALLGTMTAAAWLKTGWAMPLQMAVHTKIKGHYKTVAAHDRLNAEEEIRDELINTVAWGMRAKHLWDALRNGLNANEERVWTKEAASKMAEDATRCQSHPDMLNCCTCTCSYICEFLVSTSPKRIAKYKKRYCVCYCTVLWNLKLYSICSAYEFCGELHRSSMYYVPW